MNYILKQWNRMRSSRIPVPKDKLYMVEVRREIISPTYVHAISAAEAAMIASEKKGVLAVLSVTVDD